MVVIFRAEFVSLPFERPHPRKRKGGKADIKKGSFCRGKKKEKGVTTKPFPMLLKMRKEPTIPRTQ